jgi:hypothetical protein
MLRVLGLALLFLVGVAAPAEAKDRHAGEATAVAAHQGAVSRAARPSVQERTTPLQLTKAFTTAPSLLRSMPSAGFGRDDVTWTARLAVLAPQRRDKAGSSVLPWGSHGKSGLRLPVTERLSFAVGYRHVEGEDLYRRYAEAGSVDYDSHDFLLRAEWRF